MPASVAVFSSDAVLRYHFGDTGSWNQIHFNPQANCDMSVWDVDKQECLSSFKTTDVTHMNWLPDGTHLVGSTTTPRLRVHNGFGIWHYSGKRLCFQPVDKRSVPRPATMDLPAQTDHELYQVYIVQPDVLPPAPKAEKCAPVTGDETAKAANSAPYVPPHLRNRSDIAKQSARAMYPNLDKSKSSSAPTKTPSAEDVAIAQAKQQSGVIRKKLGQIEKLKKQRAEGKDLDKQQKEKIATEKSLREQLAKLGV